MLHRILITGGSGYLGGTLLAHLKEAQLPSHEVLFALVRTLGQAEAIKQYGARALKVEGSDSDNIAQLILDNKITIVLHLHNALDDKSPRHSIAALGQVKKETGIQTHFLFTSGAKLFSELTGMPTDRALSDTEPGLYDLQKSAVKHTPFPFLSPGVEANCAVIEAAETHGVRSYIFAPCIVYGRGEGFGNKISIQTVAIVKAAKALCQVYRVDEGKPSWPVCHVLDTTSLYIELLRAAIAGKEIGYGKNGFYLASSGSVAWNDIYIAFARSLKIAGAVDEEIVKDAGPDIVERMSTALGGIPPKVALGGLCTFTSDNGSRVGWRPRFQPEHIIETASDEVSFILQNL